MMERHPQRIPPASRFHGSFTVGRHSWHVFFLDVARVGRDWIVECRLTGPAVLTATIRCRADAVHGDTARRVMDTLREWLAAGDYRDAVYLEVPGILEQAS